MQKSFLICALSFVAFTSAVASDPCPVANVEEFTRTVMKAQLNQSKEKRLFSYAGKQWFMDEVDWEKIAQTNVNKTFKTTPTSITFLRKEELANPARVRCYYNVTLESPYSASISSGENKPQNNPQTELKITYLLPEPAKK
jgi:hypothetical protein